MDLLLHRKEEDYNVYGEIILRVVFIRETKAQHSHELQSPDILQKQAGFY